MLINDIIIANKKIEELKYICYNCGEKKCRNGGGNMNGKKQTVVKDAKPNQTKQVIVDENLMMFNEADRAKVVDIETSKELKAIKEKEVANKKKVITSEMADAMIVEEEMKLDKDVERYFNTNITEGLSNEQVAKRNEEGLTNKVNDKKSQTVLGIILSNTFTFFNILYVFIAIILVIAGASFKNFAFVPIVLANTLIGIIQQIKAKITVEKMTLLSAPCATVIRNGEKLDIPVDEVVLDDIIFYTPGRQICADSVVIEGNVEVNESLLTGEADAIAKVPGSKLFSGSFISSGVCIARVNKVGKDNYIEKVSADAKKYTPPKSELLRTLKAVIKILTLLFIPITALYIWVYGQEGLNWELVRDAAYLILAMIPSGLFLLTSVTLALSVVKLAKNNTLVQELYCIEMLARVDVLCLDKTGTITDGSMRVCDCVEVQNPTDYTIREIVGSMMNAFEDTNPTSEALIKYFEKNNVLTSTEIIPFSSKRKFSAVAFEGAGTFAIGAPDFVLKDNYDRVAQKVERFAKQGCRVLVLGHTNLKIRNDELPRGVRPVALIVIQDHIRDDAADTINFFKQNGVDIKVISGDNPETVSKIAERVGISEADRYINLNGVSDETIVDSIFDYTVFGRVSPSQKRVIVQALKKRGKTVAMTGDGVNDILALKEADCSIAMASGSEATRYVSHLVLMDSNFASMPKVVNEGRRVINNIQKSSAIYLTKNLFAILLSIMYIIIGWVALKHVGTTEGMLRVPFTAQYLILIETLIVGFATFALAMQPNRDIIKGKFLPNVLREILPGALTILIFNMGLYFARDIQFKDQGLMFGFLQDQNVFLTIASITDTLIMSLVLLNSCKPFNLYRKIVFGITMTLVIAAVILLPDFFGFRFSDFGATEWLMLIIIFLSSYPVMKLVQYFLTVIKVVPDKKGRY